MGFKLERSEACVIVVSFFGISSIGDRVKALQQVDAIREGSEGAVGALIDMSEAHFGHYGAAHALAFADAVSRRHQPSKVAYVLRPSQEDMLVATMAGLHGPKMFRRFDNREAALTWLRETTV